MTNPAIPSRARRCGAILTAALLAGVVAGCGDAETPVERGVNAAEQAKKHATEIERRQRAFEQAETIPPQ